MRKVSAAVEAPRRSNSAKGYAADEDIAVDFARRMEDAGAAAVAVHGRTAAQFYSGCADWDVIARVKAAVEVPVIGNGDVTGGKEACALVAQTGCDAVMIGRGAGEPVGVRAGARRLKRRKPRLRCLRLNSALPWPIAMPRFYRSA